MNIKTLNQYCRLCKDLKQEPTWQGLRDFAKQVKDGRPFIIDIPVRKSK